MQPRKSFSSHLVRPFAAIVAFGVLFVALCVLGFVTRPWWIGALLIVVPSVLWFLIATAETLWEEKRARQWRTQVAVGDRCQFLIIMGTWTQGVISQISDEGDRARVKVQSDYSHSNNWYSIANLSPIR